MSRSGSRIGAIALALAIAAAAPAQQPPLYPNGTYDATVPAPKAFLGYEIGEKFTPHARIVSYLEAVAAASKRVKLQRIGETNEGRPLLQLAITSEANQSKLETIRKNILSLADPRTISDPKSVDDLVKSTPVIVWLSYGVHGNESSSAEAGMQAVYQLAAGTDEPTTKLLADAVVIVDPLLNPDGRDRYVNWFNSVVGASPNPDPQSAEHDEPWPGGRFNHFLFDMNRDWAWLTQKETRARIAQYLQWMPQVHVDYHEMGYNSTYFFFPAEAPINTNFPPKTVEWAKVFGKGNAEAFDAFGWPYYTAESFDLYYPGYGDSWPSLHGAIGMTYEQAGHSSAGLTVRRDDDTLLTLRDRVAHHFTSSLATIRTAVANREKLLRDFYDFRKSAIDEGEKESIKEYLIVPGKDPERASELVGLLLAQGVEVSRAKQPFVAEKLHGYLNDKWELEKFPEGTCIVSMKQPAKRLAKALLEPEAEVTKLYFYDISAWSLPLAYGVKAYWTEVPTTVEKEALKARPVIEGKVDGATDGAVYYLIPWDTNGAPRALYQLLAEGFLARVAGKTFTLDGKDFARGTIVVPTSGNPPAVRQRMDKLAKDNHLVVTAAKTGLTEKGINLGSEQVSPLRLPKIAVAMGEGVSSTSYGAIWFLLEQEYGIPFTPIQVRSIGDADLSKYNVLIFPDDGGGYGPAIDKDATQRIKDWIERGGTFVGVGGGAFWATQEQSKLAPVSMADKEEKGADSKSDAPATGGDEKKVDDSTSGGGAAASASAPPKEQKKPKERMKIEEQEAEARKRQVPGTILAVDLDPAHPLAFGYDERIYVLKSGSQAFNLTKVGFNVGSFLPEKVSGYISKENEEKIGKKAFLVEIPMGRGHVVLYADDPTFRLFWKGLTRLFLNSVLLLSKP
ncbi:MAG: hypothetical protein HY292_10795 [Planctomycetes bacterium]|nr:hypothetical protein [Planctomycetota bacterium]